MCSRRAGTLEQCTDSEKAAIGTAQEQWHTARRGTLPTDWRVMMRERGILRPAMKERPRQSAGCVIVEAVDSTAQPEAAAVIFSRRPCPAILETTFQADGRAGFSVYASDPIDTYSAEPHLDGDPFGGLAERAARYPEVHGSDGCRLPFLGGWIGFITYEAGVVLEGIKPTTRAGISLPLIRFCLYDSAAVYDHAAQQWYAVAVDWPESLQSRCGLAADKVAAIRERLAQAAGHLLATPAEPDATMPVAGLSRKQYFDKFAQAREHIAAGDIYEVNLTQRFVTRSAVSSIDIYRRLRRASPSPYAAYLSWGDYAVISSSPELFLDLCGGRVVTQPIKGTRPRGMDRGQDAALRRELETSPKERAELNMIVDLQRNDLGRVCAYGSVRVIESGVIEAHPTVFHRVATIEGMLAVGRNWLDLLRAACPGGSITGAPKIRAMQIIDALEPTARGVYCGSIGMIGLDGSMTLNIAIRTMLIARGAVHFSAGGAIVADSVAEQEYEEILAKAAGMMDALGYPAVHTVDRKMDRPRGAVAAEVALHR